MRNSFNLLLIVLAWFDIFFIIIAVLDYSVARGEDEGQSKVFVAFCDNDFINVKL